MSDETKSENRRAASPGGLRALLPSLLRPATAALVLRIFLGGTMLYAAVDKLILDQRFLQTSGVGSIGDTLRIFAASDGPLAGLVEWVALDRPVLIGLIMAGSQLLVGGLLLTGTWVRAGAALGASISLSLALTSTWNVSPYYYGNDLPYVVGFLVLASLGDGGVARMGVPARPGHDPERRAALISGAGISAALVALVLLDRSRLGGLFTNAPVGGANSATPSPSASTPPSSSPSPSSSPTPSSSPSPSSAPTQAPSPSSTPSASSGGGSGGGIVINGGKGLGSGQALNFSAGGTDAVLLKDGATYRAFERACTHQGTNVEWEQGSGTFYCNNHGARFSSTGAVVMGPAVIPLRPITVSVAADGTVTYTR